MKGDKKMYDTIIIGAGPGGLSAAIYTSRANMKTLILDKGMPGGQLHNTDEIENYLGFKHITGMELATSMFDHAQAFGAEYKYGIVSNIMKDENGIFIVQAGNNEYQSHSVIIATGTQYKKLGVPGEEQFTGRGVSWCAVCDGAFYKDKVVAVIGGGDSAVEEATYLTKFASKVVVVHRRDTFRAQPILVERMLKNEKIHVLYNYILSEIQGNDKVEGIILESRDGSTHTLDGIQGVFEYIGMNPVSDFAPVKIKDAQGWIVTDQKMHTSIDGLFAIGDVRQEATRQVVVAAGEGAIAGIEARHYVDSLKD